MMEQTALIQTEQHTRATVPAKTAGWRQEMLPFTGKSVAIEFDSRLIKIIRVNGWGARERVGALKVKFLSSEDSETIMHTLRENLQEMGVKEGARATISIPQHITHAKMMRLPSSSPVELRKMILFRLQEDTAMPVEKVVCDFRLIETDGDGYSKVMVIIARKAEIEYYIDLCQRAGLIVEAVRVNVEAIYHSFMHFFSQYEEIKSQCFVLADVDFSATNIIVINRGSLMFCRSAGRGVATLLDSMQGPRRTKVFDEWIGALARQISDTMAVLGRDESNPVVGHIVLTGWLPRVEAITGGLRNSLDLPVRWFDPMVPLKSIAQKEQDALFHHWFSISTLLGMVHHSREEMMDLRPPEKRQEQQRRRSMRSAIVTGMLAAYMLILFAAAALVSIHKRNEAAARFEEKIAEMGPAVQEARNHKKVMQVLNKELGTSEQTSALVAPLFEKLPRGVQLSSMTFVRGEKILLRGSAASLADVFNLPPELALEDHFESATITSADRRMQPEGGEVIEFEMKIQLKAGAHR